MPIGSYTITEGANPAGFAFNNASCVVTGSATQSVTGKVATVGIVAGGDTVTCTYVNDQQLGAIKITKTSSKGANPGLPGATFSITGPGGYSNSVTTGVGGVVCVDGLTFGTYSVTETAPPTGYSIDDATAHDVVVGTNADCDDASGQATFGATDTPLADIQVNFRDGGSGATSATITCDNGTNGTNSTTAATGWDTSLTVTGIKAPTIIHCTIDIDP